MITELIRFEPEICICNGNQLEFKREREGSVAVMIDFMMRFPEICLCNENQFFWHRDSVSAIGNQSPKKKCLSVITFNTTVHKNLGATP